MNEQSRKELDVYWRQAKRKMQDISGLWDVISEASGLIDYEVCGTAIVLKPSHLLFGKTKHKRLVIEDKNDVELFLAEVQADLDEQYGEVQWH